ncbi:hypothetical protein BDR26DRAFT_866715 [Obelidium mucronatum]|nr:hypothetical protein BDR26DRAFT_866715 [Obelidium mucronatum]
MNAPQQPAKRGRKPIPTDNNNTNNTTTTTTSGQPTLKRTVQLREAQRAHREKKALYVQELESRVRKLEEENANVKKLQDRISQLEFELHLLTSSDDATNSAAGAANAGLAALLGQTPPSCGSCVLKESRIQSLEEQVTRLKKESSKENTTTTTTPFNTLIQQPLAQSIASYTTPPDTFPTGNLFQNTDMVMDELDIFLQGVTPRIMTSEEIYGPVEVESTRLSLRMIPSLKDSLCVDHLCESYVVGKTLL